MFENDPKSVFENDPPPRCGEWKWRLDMPAGQVTAGSEPIFICGSTFCARFFGVALSHGALWQGLAGGQPSADSADAGQGLARQSHTPNGCEVWYTFSMTTQD